MLRWLAPLLLTAASVAGDGGEYLFHVAGCPACHTAENGPALAGGRPFATPFGVFYSPNITSDTATGIGAWTEEQFVTALKEGIAPDGSAYFPVFPYPSYRGMTDADARALFAYLKSVPAVTRRNREHDTAWWLQRWMMKPWQWWLLEAAPSAPAEPQLARGHYLVNALAHCGECHTPRKLAGLLDYSRHLAGNPDGPDGEAAPNITPHREHGIGRWSGDDIAYFFEAGELPNGDYSGGSMAEVIDNTTSKLAPADRKAVVRYLQSLPPMPNP